MKSQHIKAIKKWTENMSAENLLETCLDVFNDQVSVLPWTNLVFPCVCSVSLITWALASLAQGHLRSLWKNWDKNPCVTQGIFILEENPTTQKKAESCGISNFVKMVLRSLQILQSDRGGTATTNTCPQELSPPASPPLISSPFSTLKLDGSLKNKTWLS